MAETDGFEPSKGFKALASLAVRCFRPLSHVSVIFSLRSYGARPGRQAWLSGPTTLVRRLGMKQFIPSPAQPRLQ